MKYEKPDEETQRKIAEEIEDSDWFFGEIYAELTMRIQSILKERGILELEDGEGFGPEYVEASDPILIMVFEKYIGPQPVYLPRKAG